MNLILLVLLCAFISANLILIQKKYILTKLSGNQYFCVKNWLIFTVIVLYLVFINRKMITEIKGIDLKEQTPYLLFDVILTIANIILWYYLLQNTEAHTLISTINPLTIALIVVLSYVFYDQKITRNEMIGILLVLVGIVFINKK
tara:strand:- start:1475 stop:1909 length:435 start_codon:yes stop_codon:yes gene_type:complete